jgi:hypothetical protein
MQTDSQPKLFKQYPQSSLSLQFEDGNCTITFQIWNLADEQVESHKGVISCHNCLACEYISMELYPYQDDKELCAPNAFIFKISQSSWFDEKIKKRSQVYPTWLSSDKKVYFHYLIEGHVNYIQVIATGFKVDFVINSKLELS